MNAVRRGYAQMPTAVNNARWTRNWPRSSTCARPRAVKPRRATLSDSSRSVADRDIHGAVSRPMTVLASRVASTARASSSDVVIDTSCGGASVSVLIVIVASILDDLTQQHRERTDGGDRDRHAEVLPVRGRSRVQPIRRTVGHFGRAGGGAADAKAGAAKRLIVQ